MIVRRLLQVMLTETAA